MQPKQHNWQVGCCLEKIRIEISCVLYLYVPCVIFLPISQNNNTSILVTWKIILPVAIATETYLFHPTQHVSRLPNDSWCTVCPVRLHGTVDWQLDSLTNPRNAKNNENRDLKSETPFEFCVNIKIEPGLVNAWHFNGGAIFILPEMQLVYLNKKQCRQPSAKVPQSPPVRSCPTLVRKWRKVTTLAMAYSAVGPSQIKSLSHEIEALKCVLYITRVFSQIMYVINTTTWHPSGTNGMYCLQQWYQYVLKLDLEFGTRVTIRKNPNCLMQDWQYF